MQCSEFMGVGKLSSSAHDFECVTVCLSWLIVELNFHPFSSSFHAVPPVRDGYNCTRKQPSVWDNFLSCPKIAGCLPVSGSQLRHFPAPFVTGLNCKCDF